MAKESIERIAAAETAADAAVNAAKADAAAAIAAAKAAAERTRDGAHAEAAARLAERRRAAGSLTPLKGRNRLKACEIKGF